MKSFTRARITLTFWYTLILFIILMIFSVALYSVENRNFTRIVIQRDFGVNIPRTVTTIERRDILQQVRELRRSFVLSIFSIDIGILILGGGLGYFLAGKTLSPIAQSIRKQKEFLADASHELRTPLAAIQTACEVVLRGKSKTENDYRNVIQQVHDETIRLGAIAGNLLDLSRFDIHTRTIQKTTIDVTYIAEEIVPEITPLMQNKQIIFTTNFSEKVLVQGDKNRVKQLLLILLDNASKFTPEHGTVNLEIQAKPKPAIIVKDTGIGMTNNEKQKIFDRFYQADSSRTHSGAGLGLSIAKEIADIHNALIKVESEKGKGSKFSVVFSP